MTEGADEFFTWLGKCITAWASVENHLFEICVSSLGTTKHRAAIVYYRTPSLDARLELTNELVLTVLPARERDVKIWDNIKKEIKSLSPIRNRLAHHPVEQRQITVGQIEMLIHKLDEFRAHVLSKYAGCKSPQPE
jgi:hypothetical protein